MESVAAFVWNRWQFCRGIGGRIRLESVAALAWNTQHSLVTVLTRCGLPLPTHLLADEKHSRCLTAKVYLPTIVSGRVLWHLGYTEEASATAFTRSYREFQRAAYQQEPTYRVKGVLTDGF